MLAGRARLWLPANVLGIGLWFVSRRVDSPFFSRLHRADDGRRARRPRAHGDVGRGAPAGWLMAEAAGAATQLYTSLSPRWSAGTCLQLGRLPVIGERRALRPRGEHGAQLPALRPALQDEAQRQARAPRAAGAGLAAAGGGYSSYVAPSNTAIHRKVGGTTKLSTYVAAAICALFVVAHLLAPSSAMPPSSSPRSASTSADFLYDNLAEPFAAALGGEGGGLGRALTVAGSWAVLLLCVKKTCSSARWWACWAQGGRAARNKSIYLARAASVTSAATQTVHCVYSDDDAQIHRRCRSKEAQAPHAPRRRWRRRPLPPPGRLRRLARAPRQRLPGRVVSGHDAFEVAPPRPRKAKAADTAGAAWAHMAARAAPAPALLQIVRMRGALDLGASGRRT